MKIGVFLGGIKTEYTSMVLRSMTNYVKGKDVTFLCFSVFSIGHNNLLHAEGEKSVFYLPDLSMFDGIIFLGDTLLDFEMDKEVYARIRNEATCPVVSLREFNEDFSNILVDNDYAIYEMTRHFIDHHGFRDIRFVAGKMDLVDAQERLAGFRRAMAEAEIPIEDDMIFYGDYWRKHGPEIVDAFFKDGKCPEAIVCANDFMAISVYDELIKRGIRVPEDVCISGFDDLDESQALDTPLSSIRPDFQKMGEEAIDCILRKINDKDDKELDNIFVKTQSFYRQSCGCSDPICIRNNDIMEYDTYKQMIQSCIFMGHDYESILDERQCIELAGNFAKTFDADSFYICLFGKAEKDEDGNDINVGRFPSEYVKLRYFIDDQKNVSFPDVEFRYKDILPGDYWNNIDGSVCHVVPIHYNTEVYGYAVIKMNTSDYALRQEQYEFLCINFSNGLNRIYTHEELFSMRDIKDMYLKDPMTNVLNRRGFNDAISKFYKVNNSNELKIAFVSIDMDGLKYINDVFGHQDGDEALIKTSECISKSLKKGEFCARMGGDEFEAVLVVDSEDRIDEFISSVQANLAESNKYIEKDYILDVSIGAHIAENNYSITECMKKADQLMYANKKSKVNKQEKR